MQFDAQGQLIAGSMVSGQILSIDRYTGAVRQIVGPPRGIADDLAIGPDGTIVWSTMPLGIVHARRPDGRVEELTRNLPYANGLYFGPSGRLYVSQVSPDKGSLWELDLTNSKPPRVVVPDLMGLNGFEITRDNILYGPLMYSGQVIRIELDSGTVTEVAAGFPRPTAVNLDSRGLLYVVDYLTGDVTRIDPANGRKKVVGRSAPPIDNLAISTDDLIYLSHPCENGIEELNPRTGKIRSVARGTIGQPGSLTLARHKGREQLLVAGLFCQFWVDPDTGAVERFPRRGDPVWSGSIAAGRNAIAISSFAFGEVQLLDLRTGQPLATQRGLANPYGLRFETDGSLLVAEHTSGRLLRLQPPFTSEPVVVAENLGGPVAFIPFGLSFVYVTEAVAGRVSRVNLRTGERLTIRDDLLEPEGMAQLPDGRLVVAEVGRKRVVAFDPAAPPDQATLAVFADGLPIGLPPFMGPPRAFTPTGVVADAQGRLFVTSDVDYTVLRLTPKGTGP
jgi:sugar lactone lactonase YvrE